MDLLRIQLAASAITEGLRKAKLGQVDAGISLIEKGFAALQGLLADVERKQGVAA